MWLIAAILSAVFAGLTSILAKCGIKKTDSDVATALRTVVVLAFSWIMVLIVGSASTITEIAPKSLLFLILSGLATGASWICYFKALSLGNVNKVVPIDKSSMVLTVLLAIILFGETNHLAVKLIGTALLAIGIFLMIEKKDVKAKETRALWLPYAVGSAVFAALTSITHHNLQAFIDYLAYQTERRDGKEEKGLSPGTVKRYATIFQSVMSEACRSGFIEENPLRHDSIVYPKIVQKRLDVYSQEEVKAFYQALQKEDTMTRLLLMTPIMLGLRRAEIVALKWSDVNFEEGSLSITRSAYKVPNQTQGLKPPKSLHGNRKIFFPEEYAKALNEWRDEQNKIRLPAGDNWKDQDFIFTTNKGDMISVYTPTRICEKFEEKHGLRHLKLHGLRHTCASLLMSLGADAETVRDILGHDSVRTTDIYLHPYEGNKKRAAGLIGSVVKEGLNETENNAISY